MIYRDSPRIRAIPAVVTYQAPWLRRTRRMAKTIAAYGPWFMVGMAIGALLDFGLLR